MNHASDLVISHFTLNFDHPLSLLVCSVHTCALHLDILIENLVCRGQVVCGCKSLLIWNIIVSHAKLFQKSILLLLSQLIFMVRGNGLRKWFYFVPEITLTSHGSLWKFRRLRQCCIWLPVLSGAENFLLTLLLLCPHFFCLLLAQEVLLHACRALSSWEVLHRVRFDLLVCLGLECSIFFLDFLSFGSLLGHVQLCTIASKQTVGKKGEFW